MSNPVLTVKIVTPAATGAATGAEVGDSVFVAGSLLASGGTTQGAIKKVLYVSVNLDDGGRAVKATLNGVGFTCTRTVKDGTPGGTPLTLTVDAEVEVHDDSDTETHLATIDGQASVPVVYTQKPPDLTVQLPEAVTFPQPFTFTGTATDAVAGIASVQYAIDDGAFADADDLPPGDWSRWSKTVNLQPGSYQLKVRATGGPPHHLVSERTVTIEVRLPFEPTDLDQVFEPTTYLRELLEFTARQVRIGAAAAGPAPDLLAGLFFQPFGQLTASGNFEEAVRPLRQARIAIEVLRALLPATVTADADRAGRAAAYRALLTELGTSYEEIRLARVATPAARQGLAGRLGVTAGQLDMLILPENSITDAQLAELFGYRSTAPADPLPPASAQPLVLTWQSGVLWDSWRAGVAAERDRPDAPMPVIDPDLIDRSAIQGQTETDPALALWTARSAWIAAALDEIRQAGPGLPDPLAQFDQVIRAFVGDLDVAALAVRDAGGEDLTAELPGFHLTLAGFRFLATVRALLLAGTTLDTEWEDVFSIVLQARKEAQYPQWRAEERAASVVLEPGQFLADGVDPARPVPQWRGSAAAISQWRRTLRARAGQQRALAAGYQAALDAAEDQTLPALRDALIGLLGSRQDPPEDRIAAAERLSSQLMIDLQTAAGTPTTRVDQALGTLQAILFSARSGRMTTGSDGDWHLDEPTFDAEWAWMGSYSTWLAAIRVFAYPENQLSPSLYLPDNLFLAPTAAFAGGTAGGRDIPGLLTDLRKAVTVTPRSARALAQAYLENLRGADPAADAALPADFVLTEQPSDHDLAERQTVMNHQFGNLADPAKVPQWVHELFWLVPTAIAERLQEEREYLAALDWFQTVYAFNRPPADRKLYRLLSIEGNVGSVYERVPTRWLTTELNPHVIARATRSPAGPGLTGRKDVHTRSTVMSIVRCLLAYADLEFSRNLPEAVTRARTLYQTAADLLTIPELASEAGVPFPANPVWDSLGMHARSNLAKIHNGMNIAGVRADILTGTAGAAASFLPSQYRYPVLVERAKSLAGIAQQVESAYLQALERRDAENYSLFQASHDIQVAGAQLTLAGLKVADADILAVEAELQKDRADIEFDHYDQLISDGLSVWEIAALGAMADVVALRSAGLFSLGSIAGAGVADAAAGVASSVAELVQTRAAFERKAQEWQLQRQLAQQDQRIGAVQIAHAHNQQQVAVQERALAGLQLDHATATMDFLANKFTSAELFDWMSGVLGRSYAYFLQQATVIAQLAQAQLAFERQEAPAGLIRPDYWQDTQEAAGSGPDRQGLTGSVRLLEDIVRLDQYAFETEQRKLHLTTTLALSQIAATELQQFRQTGVLVFTTPADLFDQEFPGHYLRLVKQVRVSLIALTPPVRGVRANLSASGLSRVVVGGDEFATVTLGRAPESIAFSSPLNATGRFELEPDNGTLLPFEGMGVDATWRLELPRPANPFDYRTIADVLLTVEYTALNSADLRQQIVLAQDRQFSGDRAFSIREQYPDAWYDLNNPKTVEPDTDRMRALIPIVRDDFPPHLTDLAVEQVTLFCLREDGFAQELRVLSVSHSAPGLPTLTTPEVRTIGGIAGTRRPGGAAWQPLTGQDPAGNWTIQLEDTEELAASFQDGSIQDIVLVLTVTATTPAWP